MNNLDAVQTHIQKIITDYLPPRDNHYPELDDAMRYALLNGGKRLRPALVYFTGNIVGATCDMLDPIACSVEMVHCFSLVHDDLPAMDNSDLRRGQLSCHKKFGEDVAILAGDNLLSLAMEVLSDQKNAPISAKTRLELIHILCKATGSEGMVGGQIMDIKSNIHYSQSVLKKLHSLKTGALIKASIMMGASCTSSPLSIEESSRFNKIGDTLGLLYQVCDDILDVNADKKILGKPAGTDQTLGKYTYVDVLGMEGAQNYANQLRYSVKKILAPIVQRDQIESIVEYIYTRTIT